MALPRLGFPESAAAHPASAFATSPREIWLEIGFGGGEHVASQAEANPSIGLIAAEVFENGICALLSRLCPDPADPATAPLPGNLRLWPHDARALIRALPASSLNRLFLLFPDPWPKSRHARRRFVHPATLESIARVLAPGAEWRIASDDPTYQAWVGETLADQPWFDAPPPAAQRPDGWPPTRYEAKARAAGRQSLYWSVRRRLTSG